MLKYIFYDKTLIAAIENGRVVFDSLGIKKSGMPREWKTHIEHHLLNALPEGVRYETLAVLASKSGSAVSRPIELVPYLDDLPYRFSVGDEADFPGGEGVRRFVPLPEDLPSRLVRSKLSPAFLHPQSEVRRGMRPSFSGYQDKFVAKLTQGEGGLILSAPEPDERGNVIVKPGNIERPYIAENEYACMTLAANLGLRAPRVFLFSQTDANSEAERRRNHLLVERFDYDYDYALGRGGEARKLPIAEIASLMSLTSDTKYDATTEAVFETARENLSPDGLRDFARMYFFGILVCNSDMHTKNFSFILSPEDRSYNPSPLYDCLCTAVYGFKDVLALKLGGAERPQMRDVVRFMKSFLSVGEMREMAERSAANLLPVLEDAFSLHDRRISHAPRTTLDRINAAISERISAVLKATDTID